MPTLTLIGIGTGHPDHLTEQARKAIRSADLILVPHKGSSKSDLADLRFQIIEGLRPLDETVVTFQMPVRDGTRDYVDAVNQWHDEIAAIWTGKIVDAGNPENAALLVWGDPSLYDSTIRIAKRLDPLRKIVVVPGLTSVQLLTAAHAIPLNTLAAPVTITTGRRLRDQGWPDGAETLAVMLDGGCAFRHLDPGDFDIWWGAYLGMAEEILCSGPLADVSEQIQRLRAEARADHGWIMDVYLLRRRA
ncbi:precorrin-6A synthase (deacetylating) [Pontivivens insulae]|uniref:precorrin-6A synthase (deacetylating) n=1 Tax=Pontivivens insulae TaxID=1639689 RepID=UPI000D558834|nr:precorrin-6A synthase (deacetylating) [Pontivivens insulae]